MFLVCDTIPRFVPFCMDVCGRGENLFLCSLGEWAYSYRSALPMSPALPFIGGAPPPLLPPALSRQTAAKKVPPPVLLHLQPVPGFRLLQVLPGSTRSAPFPPAAGSYFAKYLFSELQIHALSFFFSRFWMFCINSLSASVTASAVISIWSAGLSPAESRNATNAFTFPAIA